MEAIVPFYFGYVKYTTPKNSLAHFGVCDVLDTLYFAAFIAPRSGCRLYQAAEFSLFFFLFFKYHAAVLLA